MRLNLRAWWVPCTTGAVLSVAVGVLGTLASGVATPLVIGGTMAAACIVALVVIRPGGR